MRKAALIEWSRLLGQWASSEVRHNDEFHTIRLERLTHAVLTGAHDLLKHWDPRFSLQAVRSLPHGVVAAVCQLLPEDTHHLFQVVRTLSTVAATAPGTRWPRSKRDHGTDIGLSSVQLLELELRIPDLLGRLIGACHLLVWSRYWYRWGGKGLRIHSFPPAFDRSALATINGWDGRGFLLVPTVTLTNDDSIEQAAYAYDQRREKQNVGLTRAGLLQPRAAGPPTKAHRLWQAIPRPPEKAAVPVHIPKIDKTFPAPNWYPVLAAGWQEGLCLIGRYFEHELTTTFGVSATELELCLAALGLVVERQTQCGWLRQGRWRGQHGLIVQSPSNASDLEGAALHLVSVLQRGTVRAQPSVFRKALAAELAGLGVAESASLAERFFAGFTGVHNPSGFSKPSLFFVQDEYTCVHDLTSIPELLEGLLATVTRGDGTVANTRSRLFEHQAREHLKEALHLAEDQIPWSPNKDVLIGDTNFGDVDFCFIYKNALINLDMKSWQRTVDYDVGHYHTIQARQRELVKQLQKTERRGNALLTNVRRRGVDRITCLSFLIVATPEYLTATEPLLWYGAPPAHPRVITVEELCQLVTDDCALTEAVAAVRNPGHATANSGRD